jgi:hypothetical protein
MKLTAKDVSILKKAILDAGTFKESEHPRVKSGPEGGQFTTKGGGGASGGNAPSPNKPTSPAAEPKLGKRLIERNKVAQELFGKNFMDLPPGPYKNQVKKIVRERGLIRPKAPLGAKLGIAGQVGYGFQKKMALEMFGKGFNDLNTGEKKQVKEALRNRGIVRPVDRKEASEDENSLRVAKVLSSKNLGGGVNATRIVNMEGGLKGVFKVATAGWAGDDKTEVAAWEVGKLVGMGDIMSPCVFREIDGNKGCVMKFWDGQVAKMIDDPKKKYDGDKNMYRAAGFDYIIGNGDRHDGNWMISQEGQLQLIDNGFSFKEQSFNANKHGHFSRQIKMREEHDAQAKLGLVPKGDWEEITPPYELAKPYVENLPQILDALKKTGLNERQIDGVRNRIAVMANSKTWKELRAA